tara:strand:- start:680 stop:976 length:297 start_codon:yes stop_codon:yes gene_type:complete
MSNRFAIISLILLLLLNIVDATVTIIVIDAGIAEEVNPIMNFFLQMGYLHFLFVKFLTVFLASYVFWKYRARKAAAVGMIFSLCSYICLVLYFCLILL